MFGEKLKELRREKALSQKEVAQILGCSQSMITRWEALECEPTESYIVACAKYFDVSADYLLGLSEY